MPRTGTGPGGVLAELLSGASADELNVYGVCKSPPQHDSISPRVMPGCAQRQNRSLAGCNSMTRPTQNLLRARSVAIQDWSSKCDRLPEGTGGAHHGDPRPPQREGGGASPASPGTSSAVPATRGQRSRRSLCMRTRTHISDPVRAGGWGEGQLEPHLGTPGSPNLHNPGPQAQG